MVVLDVTERVAMDFYGNGVVEVLRWLRLCQSIQWRDIFRLKIVRMA